MPKAYLPAVLANLRQILIPGGVMMVVMPNHNLSVEEMVVEPETGKTLYWYAAYETEEMRSLLISQDFNIIDVHLDDLHGAQSFLVRK